VILREGCTFSWRLIVAFAAAAATPSCGGASTAIAPPVSSYAQRPNFDFGYRVLHRFVVGSGGYQPFAALAVAKGNLYGTTGYGGVGCASDGCGTLYVMAPSGEFRLLYRFPGPSSGASATALPVAKLRFYRGDLYGTTSGIGYGVFGAVFRSTLAGKVNYLYKFSGGKDQGHPGTPLTVWNDELYGTAGGGYSGPGTVYELAPSGHFQTIYGFKGGGNGYKPTGLIAINGELYGATYGGGKSGWGTIFKISSAGKFQTIHDFKPPSDGQGAAASMILFEGDLYGTTVGGGSHGVGTVYKIDPTTYKESVVYSFAGSRSNPDGSLPEGSLIAVDGNFYGTTSTGGVPGGGTIFELTPAGAERVIHNFGAPGDGAGPTAGLAELGGKLYGTTAYGGACPSCGTIFTITPP
jgi:uncharacterized repeat protein (TIGR03803 family)